MTPELAHRLLEHVHGHVGLLAVVALAHPAIVLRREGRRAPLSVALATALATAATTLGMVAYPAYRNALKQRIFLDAPQFGWLFERKEHLAWAAVLCAWVGAVSYVAAQRRDDAAALVRIAQRSFATAALLAAVVAAFGVAVAVVRTF